MEQGQTCLDIYRLCKFCKRAASSDMVAIRGDHEVYRHFITRHFIT